VEGIKGRGIDFHRVVCEHDLEGVVAKWRGGTYQTTHRTSWLKIRNPNYTQWDGRRELFEGGRDNRQRRERWVRPQVVLA
jgi:ATP-dependent DNA ligase